MKDRGKLIGYINKVCTECGRLRIKLYENGDRICEKCNWNQNKNVYEQSYIV